MSPAARPAPTARRRLAAAVGAVVLSGWLAGCSVDPAAGDPPPGFGPGAARTTAAPEPDSPVPSARVGRTGKTERVTFVPEVLVLPGDARAPVRPATTVDGQLKVPENVDHVGWWDGGAQAGEAFGHTVIAGHVDSSDGSPGFFRRLSRLGKGDVVTLRAGERRISYRVSMVQRVARQALATGTRAFEQTGDHRLVLITCTGRYRRDRGGYEQNLVVTGEPLGPAT